MQLYSNMLQETLFLKRFEGIIWKIEIDPFSSYIALEIRDPAEKKVSFACIDIRDKKLIFKGNPLEESWLLGLQGILHKKIWLHGFQEESSPLHKGFFCIDPSAGKLLRENYRDVLVDIYTDSILVYDPKIEPKKYRYLNHNDGMEIKEHKPEKASVELSFPEKIKKEDLSNDFPMPLPEFEQIAEDIDILKKGDYQIICFQQKNKEGWTQHLQVYKNGKLSFEDTLYQNAEGLGMDSFFLYKNQLMFIRNKSEFICHSLSLSYD